MTHACITLTRDTQNLRNSDSILRLTRPRRGRHMVPKCGKSGRAGVWQRNITTLVGCYTKHIAICNAYQISSRGGISWSTDAIEHRSNEATRSVRYFLTKDTLHVVTLCHHIILEHGANGATACRQRLFSCSKHCCCLNEAIYLICFPEFILLVALL